jgi:outer membrane protein OmpA-like peptidoglycan-associated protein
MRKLVALSMAMATVLLMGSCGLGKMVKKYPEVSVTLDNPDLENKGGEVAYTIKGTIPPKYMKKKATMTFTPSLSVDGEKVTPPFATIKLKGEKAKGDGIVINYKNGGTFTQSGTFKFDEKYENAEIVTGAEANLNKKSHVFGDRNLGEGISNTSARANLTPKLTDNANSGPAFLLAPHNFKAEFIGRTAILYFDLNSAVMNWSNPNNKSQAAKDSIKAFTDFMNNDYIIDRVVISGWASPEGEETNNQGLSERRFQVGKNWFNDKFNAYLKDYAKRNNIKMKDLQKPVFEYVNNAKGEDWDGFEAAIEKSKMAQKNQILNVVRSQSSNEMREQKIREMTDIYPEIADAILPPLRRAEIQMVCKKHDTYSDAELIRLVQANPNDFSVNERLYAASVAQDMATKESIYKALINNKNTENDWRAYNNLGAMKLNEYYQNGNQADLEEALNYLQKAAALSPNNGVILNNMAIADYLSGDLAAAQSHFEASANASVQPVNQDYNTGALNILNGDYSKAAQLMGNKSCDYNTALVQLLQKDYNAAKSTLDCIDEVDAKTAYLKAVLSARMKNEEGVYSNLTTAINLDSSYKKTAKRDAEFKRYRHSDRFKQMVK